MYNVKNYTEQGGEKTVIGGEIEILSGATIKADEGATVEGFGGELPVASASTLGGVKIGEGISIASDGKISAAGGIASLPEHDANNLVWRSDVNYWTCDGERLAPYSSFIHKGNSIAIQEGSLALVTIPKGAVINVYGGMFSGHAQCIMTIYDDISSGDVKCFFAYKGSDDLNWSAKQLALATE